MQTVVLTPHTTMSRIRRTRLVPLATLGIGLLLPAAVLAQSGPATPGAAQAAAVADLPTSAAERAQLVGNYLLRAPGGSGRSMPIRVYEENGALYGQPEGGEAKRLLKQAEHVFRPENDESVMTFTVENGSATGFSVTTPEGTFEAERVSSGER